MTLLERWRMWRLARAMKRWIAATERFVVASKAASQAILDMAAELQNLQT